jgi:hypothetical protein
MTNEYKENLLKYLTGNITKESKSDTPFYTTNETYRYDSLDTMLSVFTYGYSAIEVLDCTNGFYLLYGNYATTQGGSYTKGFIIVLDNEFRPLELLTAYNTGTEFGQFYKLKIDEQGQVYGVDYYSSKARLILLNNIAIKTTNQEQYVARLRNSYFLQGNVQNIIEVYEIEKSPLSAKYFICGRLSSSINPVATEVQINVGSENTWTDYTFSVDFSDKSYSKGFITYDENDNTLVNIYCRGTSSTNPLYLLSNNGSTISSSLIINSLNTYAMANTVDIKTINILPIQVNRFYLTIGSEVNNQTTYLGITSWLYDNGNMTNVLSESSSASTTGSLPSVAQPIIYSKLVDTTPILAWAWGRSFTSSTNIFDCFVTFLNSGVPILIDMNIYANQVSIYNFRVFAISKKYNLYQLYLYYKNGVYFLNNNKIVYNENNYNGTSYENVNSLSPNQGLLYNENNELIFARNLYNKKVFSNQTISTINVPNSMLNDSTIGSKELYSETNTKLTTDVESFTKNIYEDVYINFINSIYMENQNTDNYINNITGATRLNNSSSRVLDYGDAKATKIRVTYDDDTSYITSASNTIIDDKCTYSIGIHVPSDKKVQTIEIISNDENTTYQRITNLNLENNRYYIITQDVYVV